MKNKIYLYSNIGFLDFFKQLNFEYEIIKLTDEIIESKVLQNKNSLFFFTENEREKFNNSFFIDNNAIIFFSKKNNLINIKQTPRTKIYYGPMTIKKLLDIIKNCFFSNSIKFEDIEIIGETLRGISSDLECGLTVLEKNFLSELIEQEKVQRSYFLEKVLGIKKDIQTKTIESHLTRIRKKLLLIKSNIQISSKEDVFFLEY